MIKVKNSEIDVAIVGAGPYGLSIAAYLAGAGVALRIFGAPMDSWQNHMPPGMHLKSYGDSSSLFDPQSSFTIEHYCREHGIAYHPSQIPVALETFAAYGKAFQERFVPRVENRTLVALTPLDAGYELRFNDGEMTVARRVILAIGVVPYRYLPSRLSDRLDPALLSHSADYGSLSSLTGKSVTVLGGGSSALDIAALLARQGTKVTLVARSPQLKYQTVPPDDSQQPTGLWRLLGRLKSPPARGLGSGWVLAACAATPQLIHLLPDRVRHAILDTYLGPSGGYFIRQHIEQRVELKLGRTIEGIEEHAGHVRLTTIGADGARDTIETDHLIAATGYRVDLRRLGFLDERSLERLRMVDHIPVLSGDFESSMPGLYFVGLSSARAFGPIMRFVEGAVHPATRLARVLGRSVRRRPSPVSTALPG